MTFRSGYRRYLRVGDADHRLFVRRAACGRCGTSHALLPSFCLVGRRDHASTVGPVLEAVVNAGRGVRRAVEGTPVPHTTARDWVRRFRKRAGALAAGFGALAVGLGDDGFAPSVAGPGVAAIWALRAAWRALVARVGVRAPSLWAFASLVTGGTLLATTTDPPWFVVGGHRLILPAP
jgi:hypothetical protein